MNNNYRKDIRLPSKIYTNPSHVFSITICTWQRAPLFLNPTYAATLTKSLHRGLFAERSKLYAYCLMPDHLHLLISPKIGNLSDLISRWKSYASTLLRNKGLNTKYWQRGFYDHALREEENIKATAEYIINNPVRIGLVSRWREYEHSWTRWMP
jgi:putative transposase